MFELNDLVMYGVVGVCRIEDIKTLDFQGVDKTREYYVMRPLEKHENMIYVPVDHKPGALRGVISAEEARELIDEIKDLEIMWSENDKAREAQYKESLEKGGCREWIRIIKTSYLNNQERALQGKKAAGMDKKYFELAEDLLYGELSAVLKMKKEDMVEYISSKFNVPQN